MSGYRVSSCKVGDLNKLGTEWRDLQCRSDCSYFQSWGWVGGWLNQLAGELQPWAVRVWSGNTLVGLGVFVQRDIRRRGLIRSTALFLNEYPFDGRDMTIEYNGLLADREHVQAVYAQTVSHLVRTIRHCDEIFFSAVDDAVERIIRHLQPVTRGGAIRCREVEVSGTWAVDLTYTGQGVDGCLARLSKNRRTQVRRSLRLYQAAGSLRLEEASSIAEAREYFAGLKELHTRRWQARGVGGVFANPLWEKFHHAVIETGFPKGEIQLLRVGNSSRVIGYLYNIIWRKHVYVLQTGFELTTDKRLMPGYVVHVLAVAHNREQGMKLYDFMHGDALYKRILCDQCEQLHWVVLQRKRMKFVFEDMAVAMVRRWRDRQV